MLASPVYVHDGNGRFVDGMTQPVEVWATPNKRFGIETVALSGWSPPAPAIEYVMVRLTELGRKRSVTRPDPADRFGR